MLLHVVGAGASGQVPSSCLSKLQRGRLSVTLLSFHSSLSLLPLQSSSSCSHCLCTLIFVSPNQNTESRLTRRPCQLDCTRMRDWLLLSPLAVDTQPLTLRTPTVCAVPWSLPSLALIFTPPQCACSNSLPLRPRLPLGWLDSTCGVWGENSLCLSLTLTRSSLSFFLSRLLGPAHARPDASSTAKPLHPHKAETAAAATQVARTTKGEIGHGRHQASDRPPPSEVPPPQHSGTRGNTPPQQYSHTHTHPCIYTPRETSAQALTHSLTPVSSLALSSLYNILVPHQLCLLFCRCV